LAGDVLVVVGFGLIFLVYRVNTFTSATIEVTENQKLISAGPYAIVRHPDVCERVAVPHRHAAGAGLVLGPSGGCRHVPVSDLAAPRRGTAARQEPRRLHGVSKARTVSAGTLDLVEEDRRCVAASRHCTTSRRRRRTRKSTRRPCSSSES